MALRDLIEEFRAEAWGGATAVTAGEVQGLCTEYAWEFVEWLRGRGVDATVRYVGSPDELGYTDRTLNGDGEGHAVAVVGGTRVDWTAAQYGYAEMPKVTEDA